MSAARPLAMDHHLFQLKFNWKKLQELYEEVQQLEKPSNRLTQLREEGTEMTEQLKKLVEKAEKDYRAEKAKEEQALKKKNGEFARVYAENAIPMKEEWFIRARMKSRVYAVFCEAQSGVMVNEMDKCFQEAIESFEPVLSARSVQEIYAEMDRFEQMMQMEDSMNSARHQERVDRFIQEIAEEIKREENCDQLSQLSTIPSTVGESPKGIGQD